MIENPFCRPLKLFPLVVQIILTIRLVRWLQPVKNHKYSFFLVRCLLILELLSSFLLGLMDFLEGLFGLLEVSYIC